MPSQNNCVIMMDGQVIQRSANLSGVRRYCGKNMPALVELKQIDTHLGRLHIIFENGATFEVTFASFTVLKESVANWRNLYGAQLRINGLDFGSVVKHNPALS